MKSAANYVYSSIPTGKKSYDTFLQFWEGFSRVFDPANLPSIIKSKETRRVLKEGVSANLLLMGMVLFYETAVKRAMHALLPNMEDSYAETAVDTLAWWYFVRTSVRLFTDNIIYNRCASKAAATENPNEEKLKLHICEKTHARQANLTSPFFYAGNILTVKFISSVLPYGKYLSMPLYALAIGESVMEENLSTLCAEHRNEVLKKNNPYSFGLGLSFLATLGLCSTLVSRASGVNSAFVYNALFCALFQYYIVLARLINKPLPGDTLGTDYFYYGRMVVGAVIKQVSDFVATVLRAPGEDIDWMQVKDKVLAFPPVNLSTKLLLGDDFRSLDKFIRRGPEQLFLDFYGDDIQDFLKWAINLRKGTLIYYVPNIFLSESTRMVLSILLSDKLNGWLEAADLLS